MRNRRLYSNESQLAKTMPRDVRRAGLPPVPESVPYDRRGPAAMLPVALNVGFYNYVISGKVVALVSSDSAPMRRVIQEFRKSGTLIDATQGRKTKSVIFLEGGGIATSALPQDVLIRRLTGNSNDEEAGADDAAQGPSRDDEPAR